MSTAASEAMDYILWDRLQEVVFVAELLVASRRLTVPKVTMGQFTRRLGSSITLY